MNPTPLVLSSIFHVGKLLDNGIRKLVHFMGFDLH